MGRPHLGRAGTRLHTFKRAPAQTWLVHGEPDAAQKLRVAMIKELQWNVNIVAWMQKAPISGA